MIGSEQLTIRPLRPYERKLTLAGQRRSDLELREKLLLSAEFPAGYHSSILSLQDRLSAPATYLNVESLGPSAAKPLVTPLSGVLRMLEISSETQMPHARPPIDERQQTDWRADRRVPPRSLIAPPDHRQILHGRSAHRLRTSAGFPAIRRSS